MDKFLTVKDVYDLLKVTRGTVIRWIQTGRLRAFKPGCGRFWRIRERDLKKFIRDGSDVQKYSADGARSGDGKP